MYVSSSCLRSSRGVGVATGGIEVGVVSGMGVVMVPSGCTPAPPPPLTGRTGSKVRKWLRSWERRDLRGSYWGVLMCSIRTEQRDRSSMVSALLRTSRGNFLH